ncbi:MAG: type I secretion system permease/ATPase [Chromatiales bacterium]
MSEFLRSCRRSFLHVGLFSFCSNALLLALPLYVLQVFDRVLTSRSEETLVMLTIITVGLLTAMMVLEILRSRLLLAAGLSLDHRLGPAVLTGMLDRAAQPPGAAGYASGLRDLNAVRAFLTGSGVLAFFDVPWVPVFTVVIFLLHPLLGIVAVGGIVILLLLAWLNEAATRGPIEEMNRGAQRAFRFVDAGLRNAEAAHALGMLNRITDRWAGLHRAVATAQAVAGRRAGTLLACTRYARLLVQVVMLAAGAYVVIRQQATAGVMIAGTLILARALAPVELTVGAWRGFVEARQAWRRLSELLRQPDAATPQVQLPAPEGRVSVEKILFVVRQPDRAILKGVSFELGPGESLGLVGPNAAGKSTLARVLTGVWKPLSGSVRVDGADISEWERERLGQFIGYLPQDVELFAGTVGENIARLAEVDSEAIVAAARRACVHDMILRLPEGYDTEIGEGGALLSAGQRQQIGLARALFGDPRLVVLDEPNSNLDGEGEEALRKVIMGLKETRVTLVIISHKPSILVNMDKMLVLREGMVDMVGPAREVMARVTRRGSAPVAVTPLRAVASEQGSVSHDE